MVQSMNDDNELTGVRVLVVEDVALLALDLEATLAEACAVIVGLCQTMDAAIARADADDFAVAVLDFGLGSETASPVARLLANRGASRSFSIPESLATNPAWPSGGPVRLSRSPRRRVR